MTRHALCNLRARGFTLLEVLLALALGSLLLLAVGAAIDIHVRLVRVGRTEIEQAQLARSLLSRVGNDLRCAVPYQTVDLSTYSVPKQTTAPSPGTPPASSTPPANTTSPSGNQSSSSSSDQSTSDYTTNIADASQLPPVMGLYGNLKELQIDLIRLPRADQIQGMIAAESSSSQTTPLSSVRTVTYYLAANSSNSSGNAAGMMRRDLDRWAAAWASDQGQLSDLGHDDESWAPEVSDVEFHYYDGSTWLEEWDTSQESALPMAVEIAIAIARPQAPRGLFSAFSPDPAAKPPRIYRLTVFLSTAVPGTTASSSDDSPDSSPNMEPPQ